MKMPQMQFVLVFNVLSQSLKKGLPRVMGRQPLRTKVAGIPGNQHMAGGGISRGEGCRLLCAWPRTPLGVRMCPGWTPQPPTPWQRPSCSPPPEARESIPSLQSPHSQMPSQPQEAGRLCVMDHIGRSGSAQGLGLLSEAGKPGPPAYSPQPALLGPAAAEPPPSPGPTPSLSITCWECVAKIGTHHPETHLQ